MKVRRTLVDFPVVRSLPVTMLPVQLTFASPTRLALFPEERRRREALHAIGRVAGGSVVLFAIVDDHLHLVLLCEPDAVGRLARALLLALRPLAAVDVLPAHVSEVRGRAHLEWLVRYLLAQPAHHGVPVHPALTTGSCFPDLVGARRVPGLTLQLGAALPRYQLRDAYAIVGLPTERIVPAPLDRVRAAGARALVEAAASAACAGPLLGRDEASVQARRAAVHLAAEAGVPFDELAHVLAVTRDAARKIALRAAPLPLVEATRVRLALEAAAAEAASATMAASVAATAVAARSTRAAVHPG
jgi:hypothetical protein